ncbi:hypothetical protein F5146DRAFT_1142163 [Armillaria mellea]|nr:hypothetical protein F5146DRAFT_1142163 [Armillaria mellea]
MLAYDGDHFGQLRCSSGDERFIVFPNDSLVIESKKIKRELLTAKRNPDNTVVQLSHLKLGDTCKYLDYRAWIESIEAEYEEWKRIRRDIEKRTSWLKARGIVECARLDQVMSKQQVLGGTFSTPASDVLESNDPKSEGLVPPAAKRCKKLDLDESFTTETRCEYYAIERTQAGWNVTHSIILLLEGDNMLSIRWYDAEGCIGTQSIDIVGEPPLFVVLVIILQRFDGAMWGLPDIKIS